MRAALLLLATTVVANARSSWRSDSATLPAMATSLGCPKNPARARTPHTCTPTLAAQLADVPPESFHDPAAHARAAHRHATLQCQSTLQLNAAAFAPPSDPATAPACCQLHPCAMLLCCTLLHNGKLAAGTRARMRANLPAYSRGLRGLETRELGNPSPQRTSPSCATANRQSPESTQRMHLPANILRSAALCTDLLGLTLLPQPTSPTAFLGTTPHRIRRPG